MTTPVKDNPAAARPIAARGRAFTLVETVVAVGLLAVITIALAAVFRTVGDTVTTGKRLSGLNRRAAQLERVMRRDFEHMVVDDGFLVIRNEYAQGVWDNRLVEGDDRVRLFDPSISAEGPEPRFRRIDELMFFTRGEATSARPPLDGARVARASASRVYYGHGQKFPDDPANPERFVRPALDETNAVVGARLGERSTTAAFVNPNEFAADWSLLRHQTLLVSLDELARDYPAQVFHLTDIALDPSDTTGAVDIANYNRVADNSRQVALQPAAQSIFRSLASLEPRVEEDPASGLGASTPRGIRPTRGQAASPRLNGSLNAARVVVRPGNRPWAEERDAAPLFTSGLVDIATVGLSDIKALVTSPFIIDPATGQYFVTSGVEWASTPDTLVRPDYTLGTAGFTTISELRNNHDLAAVFIAPTAFVRPRAGISQGGPSQTDRRAHQVAQQWMLDALPSVPFREDFEDDTGFRVRYADDPPLLLAGGPAGANPERDLLDAIEQADQEMLRSSVFLQGCSEFIVEWTYGIIDNDTERANPRLGEPMWYGLRRYVDRDENGQYDDRNGRDVLVADQFRERRYGDRDLRDNPSQLYVPPELLDAVGTQSLLTAIEALAPSVTVNPARPGASTTPYDLETAPQIEYAFGYHLGLAQNPTNLDGMRVRPMPWPRLIRVTVRLVDPADPTVESTYQATFRVPARTGV